MEIIPIKADLIKEKDSVFEAFLKTGFCLQENDILVIASKVFAYEEGRLASLDEFTELIKSEAEEYYEGKDVALTRKKGLWVANSGIDKSNAPEGKIVLWPKDPQKSVNDIYAALKAQFELTNLGVMMIDSVCAPGRRGTIGACIALSGFQGVSDERGKQDLYGRPLQITQIAKADSIASAANLVMGESSESTPFAVVRNAPVDFRSEKVDSISELSIDRKDCIFNPIYG
jgi:coenzyme F420-0:L-glutamate ligase